MSVFMALEPCVMFGFARPTNTADTPGESQARVQSSLPYCYNSITGTFHRQMSCAKLSALRNYGSGLYPYRENGFV